MQKYNSFDCIIVSDPCLSNPCSSGKCVVTDSNSFRCQCDAPLTGSHCHLSTQGRIKH